MNVRFLPLLLALAAGSDCHGKETWFELADLVPGIAAFADHPLVRMDAAVRIQLADTEHACPGGRAHLLDANNALHELPVDTDGRLTVPVEHFHATSKLRLSKPDDAPSCQLVTLLQFRLLRSEGLHYGDLMALEKIYDDVIDQRAGMLAFLAPDFAGLELHFAADTDATLTLVDGDWQQVLHSDGGVIALPLTSDWQERNPSLIFSTPAAHLEPLLD